jgi:hypothetical protein
MRQRKKEMEEIVELLSREHDNVDALALEVWKLVDSLRRDRELYVLAVRHAGINFLYGPYESDSLALKDAKAGSIKRIQDNDMCMLLKITSPSKMFESNEPTLFDLR